MRAYMKNNQDRSAANIFYFLMAGRVFVASFICKFLIEKLSNGYIFVLMSERIDL